MLLDGDRTRLSGRDQGFDRAHGLYRAAAPLLGGNAGVDLEYLAQTQLPTSPVLREGTSLTTLTPLDGNFNPADSGIVEHRTHLAMSFDEALREGEWRTLLSYTGSTTHDVRGFLRPQLAIGADGDNADGFNQDRRLRELYFDTFPVPSRSRARSVLTGGSRLAAGAGTAAASEFCDLAPLDGGAASPSPHIDEIGLDARPAADAQFDWKTRDRRNRGPAAPHSEHQVATQRHRDPARPLHRFANHLRLSGDLGATLRLGPRTARTGSCSLSTATLSSRPPSISART